MFTGIIQEAGILQSLLAGNESTDLTIRASAAFHDVALGESIAVNGVCLTAVAANAGVMTFNVLNETLRVTNLGYLDQGACVNLERSLRAADRMGGHFVTGHVDGVGIIQEWSQSGNDFKLVIDCPEDVASLCVKKGSISIDGISLTVAEINGQELVVWIIPHTRDMTNLKNARPGIKVNLESDMIGKYINNILDARLAKGQTIT